MTTRASVRTNFCRALFLLFGLLFLQPSCFTAAVWRDSGPTKAVIEHTKGPPNLAVHRLPSRSHDPPAFVVELPGELAERLAPQVPGLSVATRWLRVQPLEHADTVRVLLALAAHEETPLCRPLERAELERTRGQVVHSWWFQHYISLVAAEPRLLGAETPVPLAWSIRRGASPSTYAYEALRRLPGFRRHLNLYTSYGFDVPCTVQVLPAAPADRGAALRCIQLVVTRQQPQDRHLVARMFWTPVAVAGDILCAPIGLVWWLRP